MKNKQAAGETLEFGSAAAHTDGRTAVYASTRDLPEPQLFPGPTNSRLSGDALKTNSRRSLVLAQFLPRTFRTINHGEINEPQV